MRLNVNNTQERTKKKSVHCVYFVCFFLHEHVNNIDEKRDKLVLVFSTYCFHFLFFYFTRKVLYNSSRFYWNLCVKRQSYIVCTLHILYTCRCQRQKWNTKQHKKWNVSKCHCQFHSVSTFPMNKLSVENPSFYNLHPK